MSTARLLAFAVARAVIKLFRTSPGPIVADFKSLFSFVILLIRAQIGSVSHIWRICHVPQSDNCIDPMNDI